VIYCNGSNVIWRALAPLADGKGGEKPDDIFCWRGHAKKTTCAAMSPNSQWVVSGDISGAIRIWGAKGDHVQKNEFKLWDGSVKDASWSGDSTRIVAAGDGKEVRAVALIWDTGSKTGEVSGHTKQVNSISFRSQRPFRVVTGGEDMLVAFHEGPPFKFKRSHNEHSNFVNSVRYSPDGDWVVSGGSDSKVCLYTGKDGDLVKEFTKPAGITGSIWATAWSPDSSRVVTAGGDKKVRIWDRETGAQVSENLIGSGALYDQQVGVAWPTATRIISVCLDGRLLLWDVAADGALTLAATVDGTQGPLTCLTCDAKTGILMRGGNDGSVAITVPGQSDRHMHIGKTVQHVLAHSGNFAGPAEAVAIAVDDCVRRISLESGDFLGEPIEVKELMVGVGWLNAEETRLIVATGKHNFHCVGTTGVEWSKNAVFPRQPTALASLPGTPGHVAVALAKPDGTVGGVESSQFDILLFGVTDSASADGLSQQCVLSGHLHEVCAMRFCPAGGFLASADAGNKILVWKLGDGTATLHISGWSFHTARVTSLDWLPGGRRLVSGSLDRHLYVFDVDSPDKRVQVTEAHKGGVTAVAGCGEGSFASVGLDGFLLVHKLG